jgi:hypothetical protein
MRRHAPGILYHQLSVKDLCVKPTLHTGTPSKHPRALSGKSLP